MTTYSFLRNNVGAGLYDIAPNIAPQVEAAFPGKKFKMHCSNTNASFAFDATLTEEEESTLEDVVTTYKNGILSRARKLKIEEIDGNTDVLAESGFEFPPSSGQKYSLSQISQINILGAYTFRNEPEFTYQLNWGTIKDDGEFNFQNASEVRSFAICALGRVRYLRESGEALKQAARNATTLEELNAITDSRT